MHKNKSGARSRDVLAHNIRAGRALFGWSQEELGLQCDLKRTYIGALERGEINPGVDNLDKIADGMGIPAHVLILNPPQAYPLIYRSTHNSLHRKKK